MSGSHLSGNDLCRSFKSQGRGHKLNLPQTTSTAPRGIDTARRNGILQQARCYSSATVPKGVFVILERHIPQCRVVSILAVAMGEPAGQRLCPSVPNKFHKRRGGANKLTFPAGLRAIFKRTSAGLTGSHHQRAESLKERISEPRVLSLGSISISNLRDAGVVSGCALPMGQEESSTNTGDLARIAAVK